MTLKNFTLLKSSLYPASGDYSFTKNMVEFFDGNSLTIDTINFIDCFSPSDAVFGISNLVYLSLGSSSVVNFKNFNVVN